MSAPNQPSEIIKQQDKKDKLRCESPPGYKEGVLGEVLGPIMAFGYVATNDPGAFSRTTLITPCVSLSHDPQSCRKDLACCLFKGRCATRIFIATGACGVGSACAKRGATPPSLPASKIRNDAI